MKLTSEEFERLANEYGSGVPGLTAELTANLKKFFHFEGDEIRFSSFTHSSTQLCTLITEPTFVEFPQKHSVPQELSVNERIMAAMIGARPVARIRDNKVTTEFLGSYNYNKTLVKLILDSQQSINPAIPAVGRIELTNSDYVWAGTGWMIADGIIVTNRHVADVFAKQDLKTLRFVFRTGPRGGSVSSDIDFLEEENRLDSVEHPITSILWIAPEGEADVAFLRVTQAIGRPTLPRPIELADEVVEDTWIAAIGYPARDPSIRDQELVIRVFGDDVYDKKRLSLGRIKKVERTRLEHDCSTLGGNSGSVLLDLKTGKAVGIHRAGLLDDSANLGVTAAHLRLLLKNAVRRDTIAVEQSSSQSLQDTFGQSVLVPGSSGTYNIKLYIPVEINVKVGAPLAIPDAASTPAVQPTGDVFETALLNTIQQFGSRPDVLKIRSGYRFKNGWITDERVIVVEVREKVDFGDLQPSEKPHFLAR
jgi:V8-like Glu-specific endopeptidase